MQTMVINIPDCDKNIEKKFNVFITSFIIIPNIETFTYALDPSQNRRMPNITKIPAMPQNLCALQSFTTPISDGPVWDSSSGL